MSAKTASAKADVVIIGGGMVGASLALQLNHYSQGSLAIRVVEMQPFSRDTYQPSFDARSSALSYGSRLIFEKLGLWSNLSQQLTPINTIHVSERNRPGSALIETDEMGLPALGYVIDNAWLGQVLLEAVENCPSIVWQCPATVKDVVFKQDGVTVTVEQQSDNELESEEVSAPLLIVADGANSQWRQKLGIHAHREDYQQTAIITNVSFSKAHNEVAYERFTDWGPMALLPLSNDEQGQARAALVWTMSAEQAEHWCQVADEEFLTQLQQRFGHRQGEFLRVGERYRYPLSLVESAEQVRRSLVVIGNAAHSLHPVAGQGFNLSLRDTARLTEVLIKAFHQQQSLGDLLVLENYLQAQQKDQLQTIHFSDQLTKRFTQHQHVFSLVRNIGLSGLDVLPALKKQFVQHTAGVSDGTAIGGL